MTCLVGAYVVSYLCDASTRAFLMLRKVSDDQDTEDKRRMTGHGGEREQGLHQAIHLGKTRSLVDLFDPRPTLSLT